MDWLKQFKKDKRGSRPRCVLLTEGSSDEVADRLTRLVDIPDVKVSFRDSWMPCGKRKVAEAQLGNRNQVNHLVSGDIQQQLQQWWLEVPATTPNWDIASTCTIQSKPGLLLVEAKAHLKELCPALDKCGSTNPGNRKQIFRALAEAATELEMTTGKPWNLSRDHHYQISNRFAWSWKLASLRIPVVLLYLGFLNAEEMADQKSLFHTKDEWEMSLKGYGSEIVDNNCWREWQYVVGTPLLPLIRAYDQQLYP